MKTKQHKKAQFEHIGLITFLSFLVLTSGSLIATNSSNLSIEGLAIQDQSIAVETGEIEVFANTIINLKISEDSKAYLTLDNGEALPEQEIEFYLGSSLINKQVTNSQGHTELPSDIYKESPGTYFLKAMFQGNSSLYLNPSSKEIKINITGENETKQIQLIEEIEANATLPTLIEINETLEINETIPFEQNETNYTLPQNLICKEFKETVIWSSGYSLLKDSTNYQTWPPVYNCSEIGENCFIGNINIKTRFISTDSPNLNKFGEGYVQISDVGESVCDNPEQATYEDYLAYEILSGEDKKFDEYCGKSKNSKKKCIEIFNNQSYSNCYGIKIQGSQYMLVDVFEINYSLCREDK